MNRLRLRLFIAILAAALPLVAGCKREPIAKGAARASAEASGVGFAPGETGPRVALVIGNSRYKSLQRLDACKHDAEAMAAVFQKIGVTLHGGKPLLDLNSDQMDAALAGFARNLDRGGEAYLYYSGHGAQIGGTNYLLPVNYDAQYEAQAKRQAISLDSILETLDKTDSRLRVVILDACRNPGDLLPGEPKAKDSARAKGLNEQHVDVPETLVCFATKHGTVSLADDQASYYSRVLVEEMVKPGRVEEVLRVVGRRVYTETERRQQPFTYGNLFQDHYFVRPAPLAATPRPVVVDSSPAPAKQILARASPIPVAPPTPATSAPAPGVSPATASNDKASTPKSPASSPAIDVPATSWPTYGPGKAPPSRTVSLQEIALIADKGGVSERLYLRGEFRVTASGTNRVVLRDANKPDDQSPRVIVEYPAGSIPPAEKARLVRDNSRPYLVSEARRAQDGVVTVWAKEIIAP